MSMVDNEDTTEESTGGSRLPVCVILNPREGAVFRDHLSGIHLSTLGGTDAEGEPTAAWTRLPKDGDMSRVREALRLGLLLPCDSKGRSKAFSPMRKLADSVKELMTTKDTKELIVLVDQVDSREFLEKMLEFELTRDPKVRRSVVVNYIREKRDSPAISGKDAVRKEQAFIYSAEKQAMVPDELGIR